MDYYDDGHDRIYQHAYELEQEVNRLANNAIRDEDYSRMANEYHQMQGWMVDYEEALKKAYAELDALWSFYGQGLEVANWHQI